MPSLSDGSNDRWAKEGERQEIADELIADALASGNLDERGDLPRCQLREPPVRPGNHSEQGYSDLRRGGTNDQPALGASALDLERNEARAERSPPPQEDYGRERTQPSGAPYLLSCLVASSVVPGGFDRGRRTPIAIRRCPRHPNGPSWPRTTRRVRGELGWYLISISATKRDHSDADRQIRYQRYGSSPKARPTTPLFS